MFMPKSEAEQHKLRVVEQARREGYARVEVWVTEALPAELRRGVVISVQEVSCSDPECCPIDTAVAILFASGGRGLIGIPLEAKNITKDTLMEHFPTIPVLTAWSCGEDAEWPPYEDSDMDEEEKEQEIQQRPKLRFGVGQNVICRVGPDPVNGWASGRVKELWYREPSWPESSWAPYKIELSDGRNIFAPGDVDQIIRQAP
ncbi:hypothetical protein THAOC_02794 [Thalassiosira oceanica]|uniref:Uncharacterized protein n=1 Tax=Thalassiosira oceanica TaxID=159749 RepID=K0TE99_THAOC|nr:hypothetical protein THAOC_02794 [Thalassiosira oceanica]|mmetsp:Transcript_21900/g.48684  ORF Transcript_21900/g.48684 Transcript_21900/m.48684 type:complete len:202 (+) Transcript_21900:111-716(+)|eukprot:EJK75479.1 hypothetical protein THAOC_02794 [Thalassiosira oceanica]